MITTILSLWLFGQGPAPQPSLIPTTGGAVYTKAPVPMSDRGKCRNTRLCVYLMRSCRCNPQGVCLDIKCDDEIMKRYCFCAQEEKQESVWKDSK
jgi:hypothetical protein